MIPSYKKEWFYYFGKHLNISLGLWENNTGKLVNKGDKKFVYFSNNPLKEQLIYMDSRNPFYKTLAKIFL